LLFSENLLIIPFISGY